MIPNDLHNMIETVTNATWTRDETDPYIFYYLDPNPSFYKKLEPLPVEIYRTVVKDKVTLLIVVYSEVEFE